MKTFQITAYADRERGLPSTKILIEATDLYEAMKYAWANYPEYKEVGVTEVGKAVN